MTTRVPIEMSLDESPVPKALDLYYSHLVDLLQPTSEDRIALNSTLVTFDIDPKARLYNEQVFRSFADRTIKGSPTQFGLASANYTETFSYTYTEVLRKVVASLDIQLSQEQRDLIDLQQRHVAVEQEAVKTKTRTMLRDWSEVAQLQGLKPEDKDYLDKQVAYFNAQGFADDLRSHKEAIAEAHQKIATVRSQAYPDDEARELALLHQYATSSEFLMARPNTPELEIDKGYDEVQLGQMWVYGNLQGVFDVAAEVRPSGSLTKFIGQKGARNFRMAHTDTVEHVHDVDWHSSGSASKFLFFKADATVDSERHLRESLTKVRTIELGFENIAEYWVRRGRWYSPGALARPRIQKLLEKYPNLAHSLAHAVSSVVIGRGLQVKLYFEDTAEFDAWEKLNVSGGASFSVFGISFGLGSQSYHSYTHDKRTSRDEKSVTFLDDSQHCRLLAFRVEKILDALDDEQLAFEHKDWDETPAGRELLAQLKAGVTRRLGGTHAVPELLVARGKAR